MVYVKELFEAEQVLLARYVSEFNGKAETPIHFVQIGAHKSNPEADIIGMHVRAGGWQGVMVEPQAEAMAELKSKLADLDGLNFEEIAIAEPSKAGIQTLFVPGGANELATLEGQVANGHSIHAGYAINNQQVSVEGFDQMMARHKLPKLDFLVMEAGGSDGEIIRSINLAEYGNPHIIFQKLQLRNDDLLKTSDYLNSAGYEVLHMASMTLAVPAGGHWYEHMATYKDLFFSLVKMEHDLRHLVNNLGRFARHTEARLDIMK